MESSGFRFKCLETAQAELGITGSAEICPGGDPDAEDETFWNSELRLPLTNNGTDMQMASRYQECAHYGLAEKNANFATCQLTGIELENCVLSNCTIIKATLTSCALFNCSVYNAKIKVSQLSDCKVRKKPPLVAESSSFSCLLDDCQIRGGEVSGADINDGRIMNCNKIQNTELRRVTVYKCDFQSCTIEKSGLYSSTARGCTLGSNFMYKSESTTSPLAFRNFPAEIRQRVFEEALGWNGSAPSLLVTLRGDLGLHAEAIRALGRTCVFVLSSKTAESHMKMSAATYSTIQRISAPADFQWDITRFTAVKEASTNFDGLYDYLAYDAEDLLRDHPTIEKISVSILESTHNQSAEVSEIMLARTEVDTCLGVAGKVERSEEYGKQTITYTWQAAKGSKLVWTTNPLRIST